MVSPYLSYLHPDVVEMQHYEKEDTIKWEIS